MAEDSKSEGRKSSFGIVSKLTISDNPAEVLAVRFSPDGKLLAVGCSDGAIRVYSTVDGMLTYSLNVGKADDLPATGIRWRPISSSSKTKNVLLAVGADGTAKHWHVPSGKCLHTVPPVEDNQLFCVDYTADGETFATAGKDKTVRVYDEATKKMTTEMSQGFAKLNPGHSSRVFSLKFVPDEPNLLVSGGWDNTVQIWDVRSGSSVRHIFGPHICGDSVDVRGDTILTGSWRPKDVLEMWDLGTGKLIERVDWFQSAIVGDPCLLYAASFSQDPAGKLIAAGGSGSNEARVFDRTTGNALVGTISGLSRGVFSVDWFEDEVFAIGGGDAAVRLFQVISGSKGGESRSLLSASEGAGEGAGSGAGGV